MEIKNQIKKLRISKGLTQKQLADLCGIAEPNLRKYELGKQNPKIETVEKIANALNVSVSELSNYQESFHYNSRLTVGMNIKTARKKVNITQKQLGEMIGSSEGMIRQYELGLRNPKMETLSKIANALNLNLFDFVLLDKEIVVDLSNVSTADLLEEIAKRCK